MLNRTIISDSILDDMLNLGLFRLDTIDAGAADPVTDRRELYERLLWLLLEEIAVEGFTTKMDGGDEISSDNVFVESIDLDAELDSELD